MVTTGAAAEKASKCPWMCFFSRPECMRKETKPKAAGAYETTKTGSDAAHRFAGLSSQRTPHLVENHSQEYNHLHRHLPRRRSRTKGKSIGCMQTKAKSVYLSFFLLSRVMKNSGRSSTLERLISGWMTGAQLQQIMSKALLASITFQDSRDQYLQHVSPDPRWP